jgi:hypothetical protein
VANVVLYAPLGIGLTLAGWPAKRTWLVATFLSLTIELIQGAGLARRNASLHDCIANSLGALAGAWVVIRWERWRQANPTTALGIWGVIMLSGTLGGAAALRPALSDRLWYGQHAPDLGYLATFPGDLFDPTAAGLPLPDGPLAESDRLRAKFRQQGVELAATIRTAGPTARLAPILSIFDDERRRIALLGQERARLEFQVRLAAEELRFRSLTFRMDRAFDLTSTGATAIGAKLRGGRVELSTTGADRSTHRVEWRLSPAMVWAALVPFEYAMGWEIHWLTGVLLALLMIPGGFYAGRVMRDGGRAGLPFAGAAGLSLIPAVLVLLPLPLGFPVAHLALWLGVLAGTVIGGSRGYLW